MNTNTQRDWRRLLKVPGALAAVVFVCGVLLGVGIARFDVPRSCREATLRAHFLQRHLALETPSVEPLKEPLRPAAPIENTDPVIPIAPVEGIEVMGDIPAVQPLDFPEFGNAIYPVSRTPHWGAMKTSAEWNRSFDEMSESDFIRVPRYNLDHLTVPLEELKKTRDDPETIDLLTEKLFYSTRFFGRYSLDSGEFEMVHPGMDFKLAEGTPVVSVAGGRVNAVIQSDEDLGLHVIIEHRTGSETFYSIYGHLSEIWVDEGDVVQAGQSIGAVGSTGFSTLPHLHFQVDIGKPDEAPHEVYWPEELPSRSEAAKHTVHPIEFISKY